MEKNLHLLSKVCRDEEYKHIAFVTRSTEKNFGVDHKLRRCSTAPSPLKKNLIL